MVKIIFLVGLLGLNGTAQDADSKAAAANTVTLSQKEAAELVLKQGLQAQEINLRYQGLALEPIQAQSAFDWSFLAEFGEEKDRTETYSAYGDREVNSRLSTVEITKSLLTGTTLTFNYDRNSVARLRPTDLVTPIHYDAMYFKVEQPLWGNFFGLASRANLRAAETNYRAHLVLRVNELEDLVLTTLRQYWNTYVAQENFKESMATKERYEKLVASVRKKAKVGYANPGELSQIQAEFETRVQDVKRSSVDYLAQLDNLITLLGLPPGTEVKFSVSKELPPVPELKPIPIEDKRTIVSQKLKVEAAEDRLKAARSNKYPDLSLVGAVTRTGLADSSSEALSEVSGGINPKTYVGIKLQYSFGSGLQGATEYNARSNFELEQARLRRTLLEEKDRDQQIERNVTSTYAIAQSAKIQRTYREKAVQELTRTYNQGRTDISILIESMNRFFDSEIQYIRAIGDYQIALNEWAAARDELIPNKEEP